MSQSQNKVRNILLGVFLLMSACPYLNTFILSYHGDHKIHVALNNNELEIALHHGDHEHDTSSGVLEFDHHHDSTNHDDDHVVKNLPDHVNVVSQLPLVNPSFILVNSYNYLYEFKLFQIDDKNFSNFKQIESHPNLLTELRTTVIRI